MELQGKKSNYCEGCGDFHDIEPDFLSLVKVGELVPDYEFQALLGEEERTMRLADFRGKWLVVMFYPADFSDVCGSEFGALTSAYENIQKLGAEVVTFSTDTVEAHRAWKQSDDRMKKVQFPMGADPSGRIAYAFGVLIENEGIAVTKNEGLALRGTFIINPEGVLQTMEVHPARIARSIDETVRKLEAAQYIAKGDGNTCPAGWVSGT